MNYFHNGILLFFIIYASFTLVSCGIGYDHTIFVTKTNVGFEASSKPPTLELDVSRLEGTVGPQFENGKKLPVLASFKFNSNWAFSPHVGSTFATGDAATTLAALYDDTTPANGWIARADYVNGTTLLPTDSTLKLSTEPKIENWLPKWLCWLEYILDKPSFQKGDVRPVFFGTDTAIGLKVAWTGMTGQFPDSAKFGYNRKEIALVPISYQQSTGDNPHHMKMSSLLATIDTGVIESPKNAETPELPYRHIQYFATGDAATLLALQKDVRLAMLARLDPNGELRKQQFLSSLSGASTPLVSQAIYNIYGVLKGATNNVRAQQLVAELDAVAQNYAYPNIDYYSATAAGVVSANAALKANLSNYRNDFGKLQFYSTMLKTSVDSLKSIEDGTGKLPDPPNPDRSPTAAEIQSFGQLRREQQQELDRLNAELSNSKPVYEAIRFFIS